jgi:asparagine synthase (glutamine-hydrolysing)
MCGIFGIVRPQGLEVNDRWTARRMADAMRHRGPDGVGFHLEPEAVIGMTRLAIIDTGGGWQPFYGEDGSIVVVANGEIYNFIELREGLRQRGHRFATGSDCETILHLYEDHGSDCVHYLRGMFAFAILDLRRRRLLLARDRMGEKPLVLCERGDSLWFSSEVSGLVGSGAVPFEIDPLAVKMYFHFGWLPEPLSAVSGTRKLPAGTLMEVDLRTGRKVERSYWSLEDAPPVEGDPVTLIGAEIDQIGALTARSDVPIGVGLSAGIDSSAIAVMAKRNASMPVTALSVGFEGSTWQDESWMAQEFAQHLGVGFHRIEVSVEQVLNDFPTVCLRRDDPGSDLAGSSIFALMKGAHAHDVRVMLSGLGGDELFWGYGWLRYAARASMRKRAMLRGEAGVIDYLGLSAPPVSVNGLVDWLLDGAGLLSGLRQYRLDRTSSEHRLVFWDLVRGYGAAVVHGPRIFGPVVLAESASADAVFTGAQYWESLPIALTSLVCSTYLRSNGLNQTDRLSMASSVESRVPLVDHRLVELVVGLRKHHDDLQLGHKAWLKSVFGASVPEDVLRRRKRGFSAPWRTWTRAISSRFGPDLKGGLLVSRGLIAPSGIDNLVGSFDWAGRPPPLAMESIALEQWARGMAASVPYPIPYGAGEPELRAVRSTTSSRL